MIIMGLDPGSSGGISIVETKKNKLPKIVFFLKMPIISMYGKKIIDTKKLFASIKLFEIDVSIIEKVHAMPRQGVTSSFQFGMLERFFWTSLSGSGSPPVSHETHFFSAKSSVLAFNRAFRKGRGKAWQPAAQRLTTYRGRGRHPARPLPEYADAHAE